MLNSDGTPPPLNRMLGPYCEILSLKLRSTDRACVKAEGLVFHGTARAIWLINRLFYGKKRKYSENS